MEQYIALLAEQNVRKRKRRKRTADKTPEQQDAIRAKDRVRANARRARLCNVIMTQQQKAEKAAAQRLYAKRHYDKDRPKQTRRKRIARSDPKVVLAYARRSARRSAAKKNRAYTLPENWGDDLIDNGCALTGASFRTTIFEGGSANRHPYTVSIDRIDSTGGYTSDNVQLVCSYINFAKGSLPQDKFIEMCCKVADKHRSHNPTPKVCTKP